MGEVRPAATVASGLALGVAPAAMGSRVNLTEALKDGTRGSSGDSWGRSALVVAEVAASLLLLLGAGLLMKTFVQMQNADPLAWLAWLPWLAWGCRYSLPRWVVYVRSSFSCALTRRA